MSLADLVPAAALLPGPADVHADLRHVTRRWLNGDDEADTRLRRIDLRLAGPLNKLAVEPEIAASRVGP